MDALMFRDMRRPLRVFFRRRDGGLHRRLRQDVAGLSPDQPDGRPKLFGPAQSIGMLGCGSLGDRHTIKLYLGQERDRARASAHLWV